MLKKQLLIILILNFTITTYPMSLLPILPFCDVNTLGNEPASEWYQQKIKDFLEYLKIDYPIPIYKIKRTMDRTLGQTRSHGIWFNEPLLDKMPESLRLITVAREASHYALLHPQRKQIQHCLATITSLGLFYIVDTLDASLCDTESLLQFLYKSPKRIALGILIYQYFFKELSNQISIQIEREADLKAIHMLYKNGYKKSISEHLTFLEQLISQGKEYRDPQSHLSAKDEFHYIKNYLFFLEHKKLENKSNFTHE